MNPSEISVGGGPLFQPEGSFETNRTYGRPISKACPEARQEKGRTRVEVIIVNVSAVEEDNTRKLPPYIKTGLEIKNNNIVAGMCIRIAFFSQRTDALLRIPSQRVGSTPSKTAHQAGSVLIP